MKKTAVIPFARFGNTGLPISVQAITETLFEMDETTHAHDYYEVIWVTRGQANLYIDVVNHTVENNMLCYLKPGQPHRFHPEANTEGFVFTFTESFFNMEEHEFDWTCKSTLLQLFAKNQILNINNGMEADMVEVTLQMIKELENEYQFKTQLLKRYFRIFLIYMARQFDGTFKPLRQSRETELVNSFLELLERNFKSIKLVAEYAAQLSVTPNYLNEVIKRNTGYSAGHHIRQRVVLEAKRMCRYSDAGMKQISQYLGFANCYHFSKYFKMEAGTNFTNFKKNEQNISMLTSLHATG